MNAPSIRAALSRLVGLTVAQLIWRDRTVGPSLRANGALSILAKLMMVEELLGEQPRGGHTRIEAAWVPVP